MNIRFREVLQGFLGSGNASFLTPRDACFAKGFQGFPDYSLGETGDVRFRKVLYGFPWGQISFVFDPSKSTFPRGFLKDP